ncbi:hypothetical protein KI387_032963, partial [Taxus chinensis]
MDQIFGHLSKFLIVYIDDILVFSQNTKEHLEHLEEFYQTVYSNGLCLSPTKMETFKDTVQFLGITISNGTILLQEHIVSKISLFPDELPDKTQLQRFLGCVNYIARFYQNVAADRILLNKRLRKNAPAWNSDMTNVVRRIKQSCQSLPSLSLSGTGFKIIETDASEDSWGAILKECKENGKEEICRYASGSFRGPELKYHSSHKEILAAKRAIQSFLFFIQHEKFLLRTDLQHFKGRLYKGDPTNKTTYGRLQRWAQWFDRYDFEVEHISGKHNALADFASRELVQCKSVNVTQIIHEYLHPVWDTATCLPMIRSKEICDQIMSQEAEQLLVSRDIISVSHYNMTEVASRFVDPDIPTSDFHTIQDPMVFCNLKWPWRHSRETEPTHDTPPLEGIRLQQLIPKPNTLWRFELSKLWPEGDPLTNDAWNRPSRPGDQQYIYAYHKYFLVKLLPTKLSNSPLLNPSPDTVRNIMINCKIPWFVKMKYYVITNHLQGHHANPNGALWRKFYIHHTMNVPPPAPGYPLRIPDQYLFPTRTYLRRDTDGTRTVSRLWYECNTNQLFPTEERATEDSSSSSDDEAGP